MDSKDISVALGIVALLGGGFISYGRVQAQTVQVKDEVEEVRQEVKEVEKEVYVEENINIRQSIMLENIANILEKVEAKL